MVKVERIIDFKLDNYDDKVDRIIYSGTSELRTPRDHAKYGGILYIESASVNVMALSSCRMPRLVFESLARTSAP